MKPRGTSVLYRLRNIKENVVLEHRYKVEKILGRKLATKNQIHHRDGKGWNNENSNIIVCEDQAYHRLLESREKAYRACGNASYRRCVFCKTYDDPANLYHNLVASRSPKGDGYYHHRVCVNKYMRDKKSQKRI